MPVPIQLQELVEEEDLLEELEEDDDWLEEERGLDEVAEAFEAEAREEMLLWF